MKILFSPSETKSPHSDDEIISSSSFIFENLYEKRLEILEIYNDYIKTSDKNALIKLFGTKKENEISHYNRDIFTSKTTKSVLRYTGVAYKALDYRSLDEKARNFIDQNVVIFSNLFGAILAGDKIPDYKLKQGQKIGDINVENFYKENFSDALDEFLGDEILDLRAAFYEKFYEIKKPYLTMKFIKNGKILSHFAKHYRGKILREIALNSLSSIDGVLSHGFENLEIIEIKKIKNKTEISYKIFD